MVSFTDENGETKIGTLIDLVDEGMFVIRTDDGQQHDVSANQIQWNQ